MFETFKDRKQAGEYLAQALTEYKDNKKVIVLCIPRGGIELGAPVAHELNAPLDLFVTRKIGAPDNEEFAIGSLAETGEIMLNDRLIAASGYLEDDIQEIIDEELKEAEHRVKKYRGHKLPSLKGKIVLLVDDGLATGFTMLSAAKAIKKQKPEKLVVAIPVAPPDSINKVKKIADEVVCLNVSSLFFAVGQFYENFPQTTDEEVTELMKEFREKH